MVKGTITNTNGNPIGVTVNGIIATVNGNQFTANHVPLVAGANTITAKATDSAGQTATASITVNATTTGSYIQLTTNIESGLSPFEPTLSISGYANGTTPQLTYIGPGTVDFANCSSYDACKVKMTTEGTYEFTASGTTTSGQASQDTIAITVLNKAEIDALLKASWNGMKNALVSGDVEGAVSYIVPGAQDRYRAIFNDADLNAAARFSEINRLEIASVYERTANGRAMRLESDREFAYPVIFVKDANGVWKIRGF